MERTFINIGYITKTNINNLNSGENLGNLIIAKKVRDSKGNAYIYVSGQAIRHYIKATMNEIGMKLTSVDDKGAYIFDDFGDYIKNEKDPKKKYKKIIEKCPDLDLFGFMEAKEKGSQEKKEGALRRWSPVKVSPMISIYPWKGESDLLTRKREGIVGGDLVKIEINPFNFMRGTIVIHVDEIGGRIDENVYTIERIIDEKEKKKRLNLLIESLKYLDGGAKKARLLDDLTPKFVVISKQKTGTPIFLNALNVNNGAINIDLIKEAIEEYKVEDNDYVVGIRNGIFSNEDEIKNAFNNKVMKVNEAFDKIKYWLDIDDGNNQIAPV